VLSLDSVLSPSGTWSNSQFVREVDGWVLVRPDWYWDMEAQRNLAQQMQSYWNPPGTQDPTVALDRAARLVKARGACATPEVPRDPKLPSAIVDSAFFELWETL
jgi:hypothetical protein